MKCTIIMAVLDSHELFRRQMRRLTAIVPADFEVIVLDDGSEIPLRHDQPTPFPFRLVPTHDKRPWTNDLARNRGAAMARSDLLLMIDVDHVLTPELLERVGHFRGDMLKFHRQVADLDEHGELGNLRETLAPSPNNFAIRRTLFQRMGGYDRGSNDYGSDRSLRRTYQSWVERGLARPLEVAGTIYVVTRGVKFHGLSRRPVISPRSESRPTRLPLVFSGSPGRPSTV